MFFDLILRPARVVCGCVGAALLFGLIGVLASPQTAHAQTNRYDAITVEGNIRIDTESVLRFASLPSSGAVSASELNSAYRRIADAAVFESFEIRPEGNRLVISVVEFPVINEISIEGNDLIEDGPLMAVVRSTPRHVYRPSLAEQDAAAIAEQYRIAGRYAAVVSPKIIRRVENRVDLIFEVVEGQVVETERISFVGNRIFSGSRLRSELGSKQAGIFRPFVKSDTFVEERIALDKEQLTNFYFKRGYIDFKVLSVTAEFTAERDAFFLVFTVREGQQYRFGTVTASSEVAAVDADEYLGEFQGPRGGIYSPAYVEDAVKRMEFLAVSRGMQFVFVEPEITRDRARQMLNVNFRIYRGDRTFVERIDISGNITTLDKVIRRQFEFAEGDPLNTRKISEAAERIRALRYFRRVNVRSEQGSSPSQAIVKVGVEENPTGSLSFGAAWAQDAGFSGTISLTERNLLGRGQYLSFGLETGKNAAYTLTFVEPQFLDRDVALELETSLSTTRGLGQRFTTEEWRTAGRLVFPLGESARVGFGTGFSTYEMGHFFSGSHIITNDFKRGRGDRVFANFDVSYDSRITGFDPKSGYVLSFGQEFARGLQDRTNVITTTAKAGGQTAILNESVTLTGELEGGSVIALGSETRVRDRFLMNSSLMRGFDTNGIGPRDFYVGKTGNGSLRKIYTDPLGGNLFAAMRLESKFPIGFPDEIGIKGGLFYDMGSIWGLNENTCANYQISPLSLADQDVLDACVVDDGLNIRSAVGVSLFWETLFGPLRFNFANPLTYEVYDQTQSFSLTIDSQF